MAEPILEARALDKSFVLHNQGGVQIHVFDGLNLVVEPGECVVLSGPSGTGKSTLMRAIYGNYLISEGSLTLRHRGTPIDLAGIDPGPLRRIRRETMGYVSQFLRVIPRVATIDLVMEPMMLQGADEALSRDRAQDLLTRLNLPRGHWDLPPATFSGGEQQRVNVARGFGPVFPLMLLDEPTASLDAVNRDVVIDLIRERLKSGAAVIGIFHDQAVREALEARIFDMTAFRPAPEK